MDNYIDINDYLLLNKEQKMYYSYIVILCLLIIIVLSLLKVEKFYELQGYILDELIVINVNINDINKITSNRYLYMNNKEYEYSVYDISEEINAVGDNYYKEVRLKITLDDTINNDFNILKIKIKLKSDRFYKIIINKMKGVL